MRALFTLFASFVFAISFSWAQQTKTATINLNNYNSYDDFYENGPPWYGIHTGFVNCNDTNERDNRYCSLLGEPDYNFSKEGVEVNRNKIVNILNKMERRI